MLEHRKNRLLWLVGVAVEGWCLVVGFEAWQRLNTAKAGCSGSGVAIEGSKVRIFFGARGAAAEGWSFLVLIKCVPHLRWSQAPPLPWLRPGSADIYIYIYIIYILYGLPSEGPCNGFPLRKPPGFQHQTPRKLYFLSSRKRNLYSRKLCESWIY